MSQYRSDRDAARLRIEALEAKLAEREADLAAKAATIAVRDAEIGRLRRELAVTGVPDARARPLHTAWATRVTGLALGCAAIAGAAGVVVLRGPAPASVVSASAEAAPVIPEAPTLADPAPMLAERDPPAADTAAPPRPDPRVWGDPIDPAAPSEEWRRGATPEEIRAVNSACTHLGSRLGNSRCRALALDALRRKRAPGSAR